MSITDEQLRRLIETLPNQWFTQSIDVIQALEQQAQNQAGNTLLHEYLAHYFHLAGDYQKAAFYTVHCDPILQLNERNLFTFAITQTILDYYIFQHGGSLNGTCMQAPATQDILPAMTMNVSARSANPHTTNQSRSTTTQQELRPFHLLLQLRDQSKIQQIIDQVIANSSRESITTFKLHTKQLGVNEIEQLSNEQLEILKKDLNQVDDMQYRNKLLQQLAQHYLDNKQVNKSIECVLAVRGDVDFQFDYLYRFITANMDALAVQTAFCYFENLNSNILQEIKIRLNSLAADKKTPISALIANSVLSGKISTTLVTRFVGVAQHIDKTALRELSQKMLNAESICQCFLMHSLMAQSTLQYQHNQQVIQNLQKYQLLEFYSMIGLIHRGDHQTPHVYSDCFQDITRVDPYQLGGVIIGMCYQFIGMNDENNDILAKFLEIYEQLNLFPENKQPPIIHSLAFATGLMCLSRNDEDINNEYLLSRISEDPVANYGIFLGLGLANFGCVDYFNDEQFQQKVIPFLTSEKPKERHAAALCIALLCYKQEQRADTIISYLTNYSAQNPSQFGDTVEHAAALATGLAYYATENVDVCRRLLLLANRFQRTMGAKQAVEAIGYILQANTQSLQLLSMCCKSFDAQVRAGACSAIGQIFRTQGDPRVVELLCKMMGDQEEIVRCAAIIAQAMVLQSLAGAELPEAQKVEFGEPVGDRQRNCIYKCDYKEDEFERIKNQQKLYQTPGSLQDRYKEDYKMPVQKQLTLQQYVTQFRRDLVRPDEQRLMTQRAQMLALGLLNAGGLNMSLRLKTDLQVAAYSIYQNSVQWYPFMPVIGLCMDADFVACVQVRNNEAYEVDTLFNVRKQLYNKHGYSVLSKEVKHTQLEKYIQKARLSQQDLKDTQKSANRFKFMRDVRNIAMDEFMCQANNVKLSDVLAGGDAEEKESDEEFQLLQSPARVVDEMVGDMELLTDKSLYGGVVKRGVLLVEVCDDDE